MTVEAIQEGLALLDGEGVDGFWTTSKGWRTPMEMSFDCRRVWLNFRRAEPREWTLFIAYSGSVWLAAGVAASRFG